MQKCTICLKNIRTKKSLTLINESYYTKCNCLYYYHNRCLSTWIRRKNICPICKFRLYDNRNNYILMYMRSQWDNTKETMYKIFLLITVNYINFCVFLAKPTMYFFGIILIFGIPTAICLKIHIILYPD